MAYVKERIRAVINSANRLVSGDSSGDFTFSFNDTVNRISEISIEKIEIPFSFYVINSTNNVLTFNDAADSITITPGNYTGSSLTTEMNIRLAIAFAGQSPNVTFSSSTYKLTITKTAAFKVDTFADQPTSTASKMLGFQVTSATSTSVTGDSALNISGPNYILITSSFFTAPIQHNTLYSDSSYSNVFWSVPIDTSPGNIITSTPKSPIRLNYKFTVSSSDVIDLQLRDDLGNVLSLNGLDWSMHLVFITA